MPMFKRLLCLVLMLTLPLYSRIALSESFACSVLHDHLFPFFLLPVHVVMLDHAFLVLIFPGLYKEKSIAVESLL